MITLNRDPLNPINFCHIAPIAHLEQATKTNGAHLLLAHLIEQNEQYANYYANLNDGKPKIMDNSAFEMFKQGREMYPSGKLIEMGRRVKADVIVMSDYPKQHWTVTKNKAMEMVPALKDAGFGTFYVPQGQINDIDGVIESFEWALETPEVDLIGVSILTCPIAFGLDETKDGKRYDAYKLQRFLSRWKMFNILNERGLLFDNRAHKRFHCLGMTDGPAEIELLCYSGYRPYIYSWDSSAAVWAGLNNIKFDESPSRLMYGKFEAEVEFEEEIPYNKAVDHNVEIINQLL
jgi:hypothetical protein